MNAIDQPFSGQPCPQPECDGVLRVDSSKMQGEYRRRYLKCKTCGFTPERNIQLVPLKYAPPRKPQAKLA